MTHLGKEEYLVLFCRKTSFSDEISDDDKNVFGPDT